MKIEISFEKMKIKFIYFLENHELLIWGVSSWDVSIHDFVSWKKTDSKKYKFRNETDRWPTENISI